MDKRKKTGFEEYDSNDDEDDELIDKFADLLIKKRQKRHQQEFEARENEEIRKPREPDSETAIMGKYMLREMPFFQIEKVVLFLIFAFGIMFWLLDVLGYMVGITRSIILFAIVVPLLIWFAKRTLYMPKKNKVPGLKLYRSGVVELGVWDISQGYISMGKGDKKQKKFITKINKHVEASTGRPFLAFSELEGENVNLLKTDKPDLRSEEFNSLLEMNTAVTTKNVMKRMMRFTAPSFSNPMVILQIITLAMIGLLAVIQLRLFG